MSKLRSKFTIGDMTDFAEINVGEEQYSDTDTRFHVTIQQDSDLIQLDYEAVICLITALKAYVN